MLHFICRTENDKARIVGLAFSRQSAVKKAHKATEAAEAELRKPNIVATMKIGNKRFGVLGPRPKAFVAIYIVSRRARYAFSSIHRSEGGKTEIYNWYS